MHCSKCGNSLSREEKFCGKCGAPVETEEKIKFENIGKMHDKNKVIKTGAIMIVALLVIMVAGTILLGKKPEDLAGNTNDTENETPEAETEVIVGEYVCHFKEDENTVAISQYQGNYRWLTFPDQITYSDKTYIVNEIRSDIFNSEQKKFTQSVRLPDSIEVIGANAFAGCERLSEVTLSNALTVIESGVFKDTPSLSEITLPNGVQEIRKGAFENYKISKVDIPDTIEKIESSAFASCENLKEVYLPDCEFSMEPDAFTGCENLKEYIIRDQKNYELNPEAIQKKIIEGVEYTCDYVTHTAYVSGYQPGIEDAYIYGSVVLYNGDKADEFVVEYVKARAFQDCKTLKQLEIEDGVSKLGVYAFRGCTNLEDVKLSSTIKEMGCGVFQNCSNLLNIDMSGMQMTQLNPRVFENCSSLKTIRISENVTKVMALAFKGCTSLSSVYGPADAVRDHIYITAFMDCDEDLIIYGYGSEQY